MLIRDVMLFSLNLSELWRKEVVSCGGGDNKLRYENTPENQHGPQNRGLESDFPFL